MNKKVSLLLVALLILSVFVNPLISTAEMRVDKDLGFIEEIGEIQFVNESFFTIDEGMALSSNEMSVISEENWELTQEEIEWVSLEGVKQDDTMFSEELYGNMVSEDVPVPLADTADLLVTNFVAYTGLMSHFLFKEPFYLHLMCIILGVQMQLMCLLLSTLMVSIKEHIRLLESDLVMRHGFQ